jgi:hypothetical protein
MTEQEIKDLGFELVTEYDHDQYHTNRYAKGVMEMEFTYHGKRLVTCDLTIQEINCMEITLDDLKTLTKILP